jgi:hypothetical protein
MDGLIGYICRVLAVVGVVGMTTVYVWSKVESGGVAQRMATAKGQLSILNEERSKLLAAVDRSKLPGVLRQRAADDLHMVAPESPGQVLIR